ncbi:transporter substrate-binding domain-containing protein [Paenibacillus jilunlii]|uniref:L-cystine transport system substrate-binding protein n=1 Tax=Paenibacillus jilunlii TaxID=682956 RepID=A0A1G9LSP0_9BACL|nr:transporter substrate-binding domain-containing protein [Paenibacillus jilunlii]KWX72385.1 L-cystine-binding protein TcyJ [Paenibacillus jilunlii]SDL64784.1 L-cystine transport system substrate-binding protein [Paenibacillus jilunlii]
MKKTIPLVYGLLLTLVIAGCGTNNNTSNSQGSNTAEAAAKTSTEAPAATDAAQVTKIVVGTGTGFPQVCFIDENGKLTGFDVELIKEIDNRLPQYEFELQTMDFSNLLLSLETKKIDLVAHVMEKNPEREQKYSFNQEAYAHWRNRIIVAKDNESIHSLDDLKGKKVLTGATSAQAQILENYNKEHDNAITIVYQNGAANDTVNQITTGRVDATLAADFVLPVIDPQGKLKAVGDELSSADILYVFRKDDAGSKKLSDAIDGTIKELKTDGTLGKLSTEWLGADVTGTAVK